MRSIDFLKLLNQEIATDPKGLGYKGNVPSGIASLLNKPLPKNPPEFVTVPPDKIVLLQSLADVQLSDVFTYAVDKGFLTKEDIADQTIEVLIRRCDELELDTIQQGEVEQAYILDPQAIPIDTVILETNILPEPEVADYIKNNPKIIIL